MLEPIESLLTALRQAKTTDIAELADIPVRTLTNWSNGKSMPPLDRALRLADALGLEVYIGQPRGTTLYSGARDTDRGGLGSAQLTGLEAHIQGLVRVVYEVGGEPIPEDLREALFGRGEDPERPLTVPQASDYGFVQWHSDEVRLAAGVGTVVDRESVAGFVAFRRDWLGRRRLSPEKCRLVDVLGDSMAPTLRSGDVVLVDISRRDPQPGRIFALRTEDGPLVKRLRQEGGQWFADSDNPEHETRELRDGDAIIGRVVWWAHTERSI